MNSSVHSGRSEGETAVADQATQSRFNWSLIAAVNDQQLLEKCLLGSPVTTPPAERIWQRGYSSAAKAYNAAIDQATTDVLVFAHQDVFLPPDWTERVQAALTWFAANDPDWAVAGIWGVGNSGARHGHVYCTGLKQTLGRKFEEPKEVRTVDELLFIVRKSSGIRFDESLPGYHMYGTDICLEAQRRGLKCYAISAFCIHNTNGYNMLPLAFWRSYLFMRRKWRNQLPIISPCADITANCWPMIRWNIVQSINILLRRHHPGRRVSDPAIIYRDLLQQRAF